MSDQAIEQEIQAKGKTAPRVTPTDIEANIASEHYFTAADGIDGGIVASYKYPGPLDLLTFCVLILRNGFTVTGESACASPENFDAEIGRKIARANAVQKVWPLMGYALRERLHQATEAQPEQQDPPATPAEDRALPADTELTVPVPDSAVWRPRIGNTVIHKGYITNGADEHPAMITRVHGVGEGALVNVTVFPDMQSPKVYASIPVYNSRKAAREAVVGQSRANGYAYRDE
ncbi:MULTISPECIES: Gp49 family protein [Cupriavidus]